MSTYGVNTRIAMVLCALILLFVVSKFSHPYDTQGISHISGENQGASPATVTSPFLYLFNVPGTLYETGRIEDSSSRYWWVNSGGLFTISDNKGLTNQGDLEEGSRWRRAYARTNPEDTDNGLHPQNLFRLITRSTWENFRQEIYFSINADHLSTSSRRNESNGVLLLNRYRDGDDLYYTGLRVDGLAVIKKKLNGIYYVLASAPVFEGERYNRATNPSLLPENVQIGLRSEIRTNPDQSVNIKLYTDVGRTGVWTLRTEVEDHAIYGGSILGEGHAGIRTDFMDVEFTYYQVTEI